MENSMQTDKEMGVAIKAFRRELSEIRAKHPDARGLLSNELAQEELTLCERYLKEYPRFGDSDGLGLPKEIAESIKAGLN